MATAAGCSYMAFAPSLALSARENSQAHSQLRCRTVGSGISGNIGRQLCRLPPARQFSMHSAPLEVREFSRLVTSFARSPVSESEEVFFDGASVFRALFLRYRFTNLRVTITSGLLGEDRKDFSYEVIKDARFVPRFIGEWGDLVIELKDGTLVDLRCVPKFREIAAYVKERAGQKLADPSVLTASAASSTPKKGFSS
ncbi:hypothetical protein AXG93_4689s1410 [Marchantia polymorpha subsp. ruderalis]|uniref:YdbS-like PH domain-containing protein n=1 Tax=Marchantia polymorpha subsp. ruderalis TaxID=1480154 RepID=A0A176WLB6_MARPO|nr:hypothetical protein AXG93_4689s1410 [Marchantia polymorpha subsp. ruderalis]